MSDRGLAALLVSMAPVTAMQPIDLAALRAQAFADGLEAGRAEAAAADAERAARVRELEAAIGAAATIDETTLRAPFVELVTHLAEAVVGAELRLSPDIIERLVNAALARLGPEGATALRLHPADAPALAGLATLPVVTDAEQPRGSVIVEYPQQVVADGLPARLATILAALE